MDRYHLGIVLRSRLSSVKRSWVRFDFFGFVCVVFIICKVPGGLIVDFDSDDVVREESGSSLGRNTGEAKSSVT